MKHLNPDKLVSLQKRLVDIAEDGEITKDETKDLRDVLKEIDTMEKVLQGLLLLGEKVLKGGVTE